MCPLEVAEERERPARAAMPRAAPMSAPVSQAPLCPASTCTSPPWRQRWSSTRPASPSPRRRIVSRIWLFCSRRGRRGQCSVPRAGDLDHWTAGHGQDDGGLPSRRDAGDPRRPRARARSRRGASPPGARPPALGNGAGDSVPRLGVRDQAPHRGRTAVIIDAAAPRRDCVKRPGSGPVLRGGLPGVRRRCVSTASEPRAGAWAAGTRNPPPTGRTPRPTSPGLRGSPRRSSSSIPTWTIPRRHTGSCSWSSDCTARSRPRSHAVNPRPRLDEGIGLSECYPRNQLGQSERSRSCEPLDDCRRQALPAAPRP